MANFDDWLRVSDPSLVAEQYRLSQAEFERARDALAPAFALGMRQAMESPARWAELSRAFLAMAPRGERGSCAAENFLGIVFGSPELREAVSRQASTVTGIAPDILTKMMPQLATIGVETMMRAAMETSLRQPPPGLATDDYGAAMAEMMRRGANAVEALTRPSETGGPSRPQAPLPDPAAYFADAFAQALRGGFGFAGPATSAGPSSRKPARPASGMSDPAMPFAMMFDAFAKGMKTATETGGSPQAAPSTPARTAAPKAEDDVVGGFLAGGQQMQEGYARELAALFDRYSGRGATKP